MNLIQVNQPVTELSEEDLASLRKLAEAALLKESATFPTDDEMPWVYECHMRRKVYFRFGKSLVQAKALLVAMPEKHRKIWRHDHEGLSATAGWCSAEATRFLQGWISSGRSRNPSEVRLHSHLFTQNPALN